MLIAFTGFCNGNREDSSRQLEDSFRQLERSNLGNIEVGDYVICLGEDFLDPRARKCLCHVVEQSHFSSTNWSNLKDQLKNKDDLTGYEKQSNSLRGNTILSSTEDNLNLSIEKIYGDRTTPGKPSPTKPSKNVKDNAPPPGFYLIPDALNSKAFSEYLHRSNKSHPEQFLLTRADKPLSDWEVERQACFDSTCTPASLDKCGKDSRYLNNKELKTCKICHSEEELQKHCDAKSDALKGSLGAVFSIAGAAAILGGGYHLYKRVQIRKKRRSAKVKVRPSPIVVPLQREPYTPNIMDNSPTDSGNIAYGAPRQFWLWKTLPAARKKVSSKRKADPELEAALDGPPDGGGGHTSHQRESRSQNSARSTSPTNVTLPGPTPPTTQGNLLQGEVHELEALERPRMKTPEAPFSSEVAEAPHSLELPVSTIPFEVPPVVPTPPRLPERLFSYDPAQGEILPLRPDRPSHSHTSGVDGNVSSESIDDIVASGKGKGEVRRVKEPDDEDVLVGRHKDEKWVPAKRIFASTGSDFRASSSATKRKGSGSGSRSGAGAGNGLTEE